jgi:hypothetical protein
VNGDYNDNHSIYSTVQVPTNSTPNVTITSLAQSGKHISLKWVLQNLLPTDVLQVWSNTNQYSNYILQTLCTNLSCSIPYTGGSYTGLGVQIIVPGKYTGPRLDPTSSLPTEAAVAITTIDKINNGTSIIVNWISYGLSDTTITTNVFQNSTQLQILISTGNFFWYVAGTTTVGASNYTVNGLIPSKNYYVELSVSGDPVYANYNDYTSLIGYVTINLITDSNPTSQNYPYYLFAWNGWPHAIISAQTVALSYVYFSSGLFSISWDFNRVGIPLSTPIYIYTATDLNQDGKPIWYLSKTSTFGSGIDPFRVSFLPPQGFTNNAYVTITDGNLYNSDLSHFVYFNSSTVVPAGADLFTNYTVFSTFALNLQIYSIIPNPTTITVYWNKSTPGFNPTDGVDIWYYDQNNTKQLLAINTFNAGIIRVGVPSDYISKFIYVYFRVSGKYNDALTEKTFVNLKNTISGNTTPIPPTLLYPSFNPKVDSLGNFTWNYQFYASTDIVKIYTSPFNDLASLFKTTTCGSQDIINISTLAHDTIVYIRVVDTEYPNFNYGLNDPTLPEFGYYSNFVYPFKFIIISASYDSPYLNITYTFQVSSTSAYIDPTPIYFYYQTNGSESWNICTTTFQPTVNGYYADVTNFSTIGGKIAPQLTDDVYGPFNSDFSYFVTVT